jgi:hypothetical protein
MATDWSARTAAIVHFEKLVKQLKRANDEEAEIQTKLQNTLKALRHYKHCRHGCVDCFCTQEARAELTDLGD